MTLTEMRYIAALAKLRHFGRAADACHVSQPTLSVAIKKVEAEIGAPLFERSANELRITVLGERVVAQAERVLEEAVKLDEIASETKDPLVGPLRIGVIYSIAPYLLPQLVPALHRIAPRMPLYLKEDFTENLIPALKQGELDVIVLALPIQVSGVVCQPIYREPFRVVVPSSHPWTGPVEAKDLPREQVLLLGQGNCFRDQVLEACPKLAQGEGDAHLSQAGSLETMRYMVASGAGIAVMPSTAADPLLEKEPMVKVLSFRGEAPSRLVGPAWRVTFPRPKAIDAVKQAITQCGLAGVERV